MINEKPDTSNVSTMISTMLNTLFPVGSIYLGTQNTCPLTSLINGSKWVLVGTNRALWGGNGSNGGSTIEAGLPNITGQTKGQDGYLRAPEANGAFQTLLTGGSARSGDGGQSAAYSTFDASRSNPIYGRSAHVTPINQALNFFIKAKDE